MDLEYWKSLNGKPNGMKRGDLENISKIVSNFTNHFEFDEFETDCFDSIKGILTALTQYHKICECRCNSCYNNDHSNCNCIYKNEK